MLEHEPPSLSLRAAMETRDLDRAVEAFADDGVLRSPLTDGLAFHGRDQIALVTGVVLDLFDGLEYTDEVSSDESGFLVGRATVAGQPIEWVDHMRFDADGRIRELTVFFRPLPATTAALRAIGAGLARPTSRGRAAAISVLASPLAVMARVGDRVGVPLIRRGL